MSQAPAWWEDVEHLREAAERRIAERERAQREGREPVALTPLRPLSDDERASASREQPSGGPTPLAPAPRLREGRFRRATAALAVQGPRTGPRHVATASRSAPTAGALALDVALEPDRVLDPWAAPAHDDAPVERDRARDAAPARRDRESDHRSGATRTPGPAREETAERPTRREELARLAREQEQAAAGAARARATDADSTQRAGAPIAGRRTIEIRGQVARRPVIAAVPDPVDAPRRHRRPRRTPADALVANPDRIAMWAFLLGLFLVVVATISAH